MKRLVPGLFLGLLDDFLDRSATRKSAVEPYDIIKTGLPLLAGLAAYPDQTQKIMGHFFAIPGATVPLVGGIVICMVSVVVITGKHALVELKTGLLRLDHAPTLEYLYTQPFRQVAKVVFLAALCAFPHAANELVLEETPLPLTIYGRVTNLADGKPVEDARLSVLTIEEADITDGEWQTDSRGFFVLHTKIPAKRNSVVVIAAKACKQSLTRPLLRSFEEVHPADRALSPYFIYNFECTQGGAQ